MAAEKHSNTDSNKYDIVTGVLKNAAEIYSGKKIIVQAGDLPSEPIEELFGKELSDALHLFLFELLLDIPEIEKGLADPNTSKAIGGEIAGLLNKFTSPADGKPDYSKDNVNRIKSALTSLPTIDSFITARQTATSKALHETNWSGGAANFPKPLSDLMAGFSSRFVNDRLIQKTETVGFSRG